MIIASSNVNMASARSYKKKELSYSVTESKLQSTGLSATREEFSDLFTKKSDLLGNSEPEEAKNNSETAEGSQDTNSINSISDLKDMLSSTSQKVKDNMVQSQIKQIKDIRSRIIDYLLELLFGKASASDAFQDTDCYAELEPQEKSFDIGMYTTSVTSYFEYSEEETVSFSTTGIVQTADGRSIDFGINLTMSRSFSEVAASQIDFNQPVLLDPLVINVDSSFVGLSDQTFYFDLDADGNKEQIKGLSKGNGFLAYDQNDNGIIDDGSELFGASSGNGFADLAKYDEDGNGWIDEADSIFAKLKVWCKENDGTDTLIDLKDAGVGAIYLGSSTGDFSLNDSYNQTDAVIRRHGIFLYENGNVGTIQQMDMAVQNEYTA